jgi:PIN domain
LIYLDSSVAIAQLLGEGRSPPDALWKEPLVSSRLLEYEIWNRVHARGLGSALSSSTRALIGRLKLIGLTPEVLARALQPFPVPVRTLDSLHLATIEFIRREGESVELASYDNRLLMAARTLGITLSQL